MELPTGTDNENSTVLDNNGSQTKVLDNSNATVLMDIGVTQQYTKRDHTYARIESSASAHKQLDEIINTVIRNICLEIIDLAQEIEIYETVHCDIADLLDKLHLKIFKM